MIFLVSCQNFVNQDKGKQLAGNIISDTQLIKSNYSNCLSHIEAGSEIVCKDEVVKIRLLYKKTKENLLDLANLRKKGVLSDKTYNFYIEHINENLKDVRNLNYQLKEKGIFIDFK